jgi:hypothetical protein
LSSPPHRRHGRTVEVNAPPTMSAQTDESEQEIREARQVHQIP